MKKILLSAGMFIFLGNLQMLAQQKQLINNNNESNNEWQNAARHYVAAAEYFFKQMDGLFVTGNRRQQLAFTTSGLTTQIKPLVTAKTNSSNWSASFHLMSINKENVSSSKAIGSAATNEQNHLVYHYPGFKVEYLNDETGIRQNFIIQKKNQQQKNISIVLKLEGNIIPTLTSSGDLKLTDQITKKELIKYDGLKVWDANHQILPASMQLLENNQLLIAVNDKHAKYPVTIDPLTHAAEWETSANGLLPSLLPDLQLQIDALYGYSVSGVGDINGDGFDDVAVGAPGAIDIVAGPSVVAGAGAVFIYFGSANGLSIVPDRILRSTTPVANALFGFSITGGNVTGSVKNDIIVGAPGESYVTAVSGLPASATVTAGKVYVFSGDSLTSGKSSPFASVYLKGSTYFSRGLLGTFLSNINLNALFGYSVAVADDMNGDGLGEIIVGAPGYAGVQLLDVVTGAAFVYYSGNISSNTATQLQKPTLSLFPALINTNGLLFGFSVDGAGDYNKDGYPDIIVGAPGGVNLGLKGLLGGSAYIYYGNNNGVNTSISTQLTLSSSIVGSVANLFGYSVKGARDLNGFRSGNVLVSAPLGNVLSNVLSGLRLKTGNVYLFKAKNTSPSSALPDQSIASPRNSSLLSILALQNISVNSLFGAAMDNMLDVNCDGYADIIIGEPLSSAVSIINADAVGGAAYIFLGKSDGTYNTVPYWKLENSVNYDFGLNAASLIGYSVAGTGHIRGIHKSVSSLIGAAGKALDFSSGIFNLDQTVGTLYSFTAGGNGIGKAEGFSYMNCFTLAANAIQLKATAQNCDAMLNWSVGSKESLASVEIQQSEDAVNFKTITATQSIKANNYNLVSQSAHTSYYRLKVTDKMGNSKFSNVESVKIQCKETQSLSAFPTLFNGKLDVNFTASKKAAATIMLVDAVGRPVQQQNITLSLGSNKFQLVTTSLQSGVYYVSIKTNEWKSNSVKVIKQ